MFTLDDLKQVMRTCAGVDEAVNLDGDIGDLTFEALGYDSLAMLAMAARLQHDLQVPVPGEVMENTLTPRSVVEYLADALANPASQR